MAESRDRTWAVVALLGCALLSLAFGNWITTDLDEEGNVSRAVFALVLLLTAVALAVGQRTARRTLGALLVVLVLVLVGAGFVDDFRFVWVSGDLRLFATKVVLGVLGMGLLAPAYLAPGVASSVDLEPEVAVPTRPQLSERSRVALWFLTGAVCGLAGHNLGGWPGVPVAVGLVVLAWAVVRLVRWGLRARSR